MSTPVQCSFCGVRADEDVVPMTWMTSVERGKTKLYCEKCARDHLRSIEGKLDSEWW